MFDAILGDRYLIHPGQYTELEYRRNLQMSKNFEIFGLETGFFFRTNVHKRTELQVATAVGREPATFGLHGLMC